MLSTHSRRRLEQMLDRHSVLSFAFSERLASTFSPEATLPPSAVYSEETSDFDRNEHRKETARFLKPRRTRYLASREAHNATHAPQEVPEYNSSQPMDIELDEDEVIEIIKPVLQNLQLAEDSSTQLSQKLLTDNLLALLRLPYYQLSIACERLDFSPWPDDRMVIICDVISSHPDVSHQNVLYVLKNTVYQRIQYMETTPSRYFTNSIIQMAKSNGDSAIDGIIRPLLHSSHQNKVHSDLITKVVSSGLQWDSSAKLLSAIVADPDISISSQSQAGTMPWTPLISATVTSLLQIKPPLNLTPTVVRNILFSIRGGLNDNPKESSYIQLLLVLVTKHGDRIHVDNGVISDIEATANLSDSFLKKSILNHARTLQRKISLKESID